jgi:nucleoside-diphosphate-sugar epimerase
MENILVVGRSGFLGSALLSALKCSGLSTLRSFDLSPSSDPQVKSIVGDLCNPDQVMQACADADTVFQTAALVDWGPCSRARLMAVNI